MTFNDLIQEDNSSAFLNIKEFGELVNWDGKEIIAVIDEFGGEQKKLAIGSGRENFDYLSQKQIVVYLSAKDILIPVINQYVKLNHDEYKVIEASADNGMLSVTLEANE